MCYDSLDEVRTALDEIDDQMLDLLNRRLAEGQSFHIGVPVTTARAAIGAILNSSALFEQCIPE
ncbi:uncharacterized protein N7479_005563 [Penicillium vulpinum]|uniref:uncharacterized protein n=1 Tax=Penicillium vulpinum TaxID=29845 RepID=UPI0025491606|nr:uncharacterized protein N7479_005563 [Penicillium vulpinum]KAJ5958413.1 hypothetical protein N7479_005563 [Penicillium vulpinum]